MKSPVAALMTLFAGVTGKYNGELVHRAQAIREVNLTSPMVINGRPTNPGEWEGTVMVIGADGDCSDSGLCTGMFIHPEVVMTAGHCCGNRETKAICGGKLRPGVKLAESKNMVAANAGTNDFCLLHMDRPVHDVPIYEVATEQDVGVKDAIIVGYGVFNSGFPQEGSGTQREGLVRITRVAGYDITITSRPNQEYQNCCNGDSGGPIFVEKAGAPGQWVVGGVTSRGSLYCPAGSTSIYTSAVEARNAALITSTTRDWLGAASEIVPGKCPVSFCCYGMMCAMGKNQTYN